MQGVSGIDYISKSLTLMVLMHVARLAFFSGFDARFVPRGQLEAYMTGKNRNFCSWWVYRIRMHIDYLRLSIERRTDARRKRLSRTFGKCSFMFYRSYHRTNGPVSVRIPLRHREMFSCFTFHLVFTLHFTMEYTMNILHLSS